MWLGLDIDNRHALGWMEQPNLEKVLVSDYMGRGFRLSGSRMELDINRIKDLIPYGKLKYYYLSPYKVDRKYNIGFLTKYMGSKVYKWCKYFQRLFKPYWSVHPKELEKGIDMDMLGNKWNGFGISKYMLGFPSWRKRIDGKYIELFDRNKFKSIWKYYWVPGAVPVSYYNDISHPDYSGLMEFKLFQELEKDMYLDRTKPNWFVNLDGSVGPGIIRWKYLRDKLHAYIWWEMQVDHVHELHWEDTPSCGTMIGREDLMCFEPFMNVQSHYDNLAVTRYNHFLDSLPVSVKVVLWDLRWVIYAFNTLIYRGAEFRLRRGSHHKMKWYVDGV